MTEGIIFYRTPTTRIADGGFEDPHSVPAGQRLNFTLPDNIWLGVEETWRNNNKKFPIPTSKGAIKKIGVSPVGLKGITRIIRGYFKDDVTASVNKLRTFAALVQIDTYHEFGSFGMDFSPEASTGFAKDDYGDPDNTFGWTFDGFTLKNFSVLSNKVYDFSVELGFGGTVPVIA